MKSFLALLLFASLLTRGVTADEPAVSICFREKAEIHSRVVYLADVAEIETEDENLANRLAQTELVASPAAGQVRSLRQRELVDHLQLNGFNLRQFEFSGAAITQVSFGMSKKSSSATPTAGRLASAQRRIKQAVVNYLRSAQPQTRRSAVEVQCDEASCNAAAVTAATVSVISAEEQSPTSYQIIIAIAARGAVEEFTVTATVEEADQIVVAARALRPGSILAASDLKYAAPRSDADQSAAAASIDDLVGRELTRAVGADQFIPVELAIQPRVIRKGDLVEVTVRAGGVRIVTQAIAQQDGAQGETIALESIESKAKPGQQKKDSIVAKVMSPGQASIEVASRTPPSKRMAAEPKRLTHSTARVGGTQGRLQAR